MRSKSSRLLSVFDEGFRYKQAYMKPNMKIFDSMKNGRDVKSCPFPF